MEKYANIAVYQSLADFFQCLGIPPDEGIQYMQVIDLLTDNDLRINIEPLTKLDRHKGFIGIFPHRMAAYSKLSDEPRFVLGECFEENGRCVVSFTLLPEKLTFTIPPRSTEKNGKRGKPK